MIRPNRYITGEELASGVFFRAADRDDDTLVLGPSAPTFDAALSELDRDAGGPTTLLRHRLPGEPAFRPMPRREVKP